MVFRGPSAFSAAASFVFVYFEKKFIYTVYIYFFNFFFLKDAPNFVVSAATRNCWKGMCCNEVTLNRSWFFHSLHQFMFIYTRGENKPARKPDPSRQLFQTDPQTAYLNIATEPIRTFSVWTFVLNQWSRRLGHDFKWRRLRWEWKERHMKEAKVMRFVYPVRPVGCPWSSGTKFQIRSPNILSFRIMELCTRLLWNSKREILAYPYVITLVLWRVV